MALEIIERRTCDGLKLGATPDDFVPRHDPPVLGITRTFAVDGGKLMDVDLCEPCNSGPVCLNLDELRVVLQESGIPVEAGKHDKRSSAKAGASGARRGRPTTRDMDCLWCPQDSTKTAFAAHIKTHGFATLKDALGPTCPACGQGPFGTLSVHVARAHDEFSSVTDAFMWARDNGDPYGVYGMRRAAGAHIMEAML